MIRELRRLIIILTTDKHHGTRRRPEIRFVDTMAFFLFASHGTNVGSQILVAGIFSQQTAQIVIILAEKAGTELAIGGQPDARTVSAERLRDRSDESDFAGSAVSETIFTGGFACFVRNMHPPPARGDSRLKFRC